MSNSAFYSNPTRKKSLLWGNTIFPSANQIKRISNKALEALDQSVRSVKQEIKERGAKKFGATILAHAATTMAFKSVAVATLGTSAPTILGVTAAAMVGRGGLELTKFGYGRLKNYYYGVSQPALFSYETAEEIKQIGAKATFGLADALSFIKNNRKEMSLTKLFTGAAKQIGASGAVSLLGIGAGFGLGTAFSDTLAPGGAAAETLDQSGHAVPDTVVEEAEVAEVVNDVPAGEAEETIVALVTNEVVTEEPQGKIVALVTEDVSASEPSVTSVVEDVAAEETQEATVEAVTTKSYDIQNGDTLWGIVKAEYDVTSNADIVARINEIKELNGFSDHDANNLAGGNQTILLPVAGAEVEAVVETETPEAEVNIVRPKLRPDDLVTTQVEVVEPEEVVVADEVNAEVEAVTTTVAPQSDVVETPEEVVADVVNTDVEEVSVAEVESDAPLEVAEAVENTQESVLSSFALSGTGHIETNFDPDSYYLGEVEYTVRSGDGMWRIFTNNYDTSGMSNSEIRSYVDALSAYNNMSGADAGNLEIGDEIRLPDQRLLNTDDGLTQNWAAMDQQSQSVNMSRGSGFGRGLSCEFTITRDTVTVDNSCGVKPGDTFVISPSELFQPKLS